MKLEFKITLDKNKELDLEYGKSIDLAFMSYNMIKQLDSSLPDIICESIEGDNQIIYNLNLGDIDLTNEDMQSIWGKMFGDTLANEIT